MPSYDRDRVYYRWRQMDGVERDAILAFRRQHQRPWHNPPHYNNDSGLYLVTAACYEHRPFIGYRLERMGDFSGRLLEMCQSAGHQVFAWVVLPNHYHLLLRAGGAVDELIPSFGRLHGSTSFLWNGADKQRGRKVWFGAAETGIKSERHFWASLIYVLHNPVKHRYVENWRDWPFSNAGEWLESVGRERAVQMWHEFPIDDYGRDWDPPDL